MLHEEVPLKSGSAATASWLAMLGLEADGRWHVEVSIEGDAARFELNIYAEEWGFAFRAGEQASWIRVGDTAFVHGRDDFELLAQTPELSAIDTLVTAIEHRFRIRLARERARIQTNLDGDDVVRAWLRGSLPSGG